MFFNFSTDLNSSIAVVDHNLRTYTYGQLSEKADFFSEQIKNEGLVFNLCLNNFESLATYIALLRRSDLKQVLLAAQIDHAFLKDLTEKYCPSLIIWPKNRSDYPSGFELFLAGEQVVFLRAIKSGKVELHKDLALMIPTSGSTGSPKLVKLSYVNLQSNAEAIAKYLEIKAEDRPITTLPMNYAYGLSIINSHLLKGASVVLNEFTLTEKLFWDLLKSSKATTFGGVPFTYEILKKLRFQKMDLPSLKYLTQAGGKLSPELTSEFSSHCEQKNMKFFVMYGQTEATARMSYLPWDSVKAKAGSIGKVIPGGEIKLIAEDGSEVFSSGVVGELVYKGRNVCMGYAYEPADLKKGDENNGILRTNDLAERDADGFFYILGRKGRSVKIYGHRVDSSEVESILHKQGYQVACIGKTDLLVIFTTDQTAVGPIHSLIANQTKLHPKAILVQYIKSLPRNEYGKILYGELNNLYRGS